MPGIWLKSVEQMRQVEWGKKWYWDVKFPNPGKNAASGNRSLKLSDWFPALNVEENIWTLNTKEFSGGFTTFEIPQSTTLFNLKITFADDIYLTVHEWVTKWVNDEILMGNTPTAQGILCLEKAVKQVNVVKFDNHQSIVKSNSYWVFPKGAMYFTGESEANIHQNELEFIIAATD